MLKKRSEAKQELSEKKKGYKKSNGISKFRGKLSDFRGKHENIKTKQNLVNQFLSNLAILKILVEVILSKLIAEKQWIELCSKKINLYFIICLAEVSNRANSVCILI